MATFSIADMGSQLPVVYRRKLTLAQRKTPTLRLLSQLGAIQPATTGQNMTWQVKTSGQVAGNPNLDGGAFLTAASDVPNNVSLSYGAYEAPAKITDDMLRKAASSAGVGPDNSTMTNLVSEQMVDGMSAAMKLMEENVYNGTAAARQMIGLSTAVATGAYGGLTHAEWVSRVTTNGGVLRNLTLGLLKTEARTISTLFNGARPNLGLCPPGVMDMIEALFDPYLQMPAAPGATQPIQRGGDRAIMNPGTIRTIGGDISMDGFRHLFWATGGIHFIEAPDCLNSAVTNTTAGMYLLNTDMLELNYLPGFGPRPGALDAKAVAAVEQDMGAIAQIPFEMVSRGRIDHSAGWDITASVGLKLLDRRCAAWLGDIQ